MPNRTYAVHTSEENISRLDQHAKRLKRSRNSLLNEAIETLLEIFDSEAYSEQLSNHKKKAGK